MSAVRGCGNRIGGGWVYRSQTASLSSQGFCSLPKTSQLPPKSLEVPALPHKAKQEKNVHLFQVSGSFKADNKKVMCSFRQTICLLVETWLPMRIEKEKEGRKERREIRSSHCSSHCIARMPESVSASSQKRNASICRHSCADCARDSAVPSCGHKW